MGDIKTKWLSHGMQPFQHYGQLLETRHSFHEFGSRRDETVTKRFAANDFTLEKPVRFVWPYDQVGTGCVSPHYEYDKRLHPVASEIDQ